MTTLEVAKTAHRSLQSVWVLVSANHADAVSDDVAAMGKKLGDAIAREDAAACADAMEEVRVWLSTSAGVVLARLEHVFRKRE
ncbi:MAG: hypothetical protein GY811_07720 [Myxococcales bacterium]|nr:hypothetical protein [Myxococcales bacterium]